MGWLTGKPKPERKPVTCGTCHGNRRVDTFGMAPGGQWVVTGSKKCDNCNGRGTV